MQGMYPRKGAVLARAVRGSDEQAVGGSYTACVGVIGGLEAVLPQGKRVHTGWCLVRDVVVGVQAEYTAVLG